MILLPLTMWLAWLTLQTDTGGAACSLRTNKVIHPQARIVRVRSWNALRVGLLNHAWLEMTDGLWLEGCRSVHTKGMRFAIDVVFLDAQGHVLGVCPFVEPEQLVRGPRATRATLELAAGAAQRQFGIAAGDRLQLCPAVRS
jgi:hypothetical protein